MNKTEKFVRIAVGLFLLCCATPGRSAMWEPALTLYPANPGSELGTSAPNAHGIVSKTPYEIYAAYTRSYDADHSELAVERSSDNGASWERFKPGQTLNPTLYPSLAPSNRSGSVHIGWLERVVAGSSQGYVWYQHWPDPPVRLSSQASAQTPCVASSDPGVVIVAWSKTVPGLTSHLYRRSTDNGVTWSGEQYVAENIVGQVTTPISVAFGDGGTVHAVWTAYNTGESRLWYKRSSDWGETWQDPPVELWYGNNATFDPTWCGPAISATSDRTDVVWCYWTMSYEYMLYGLTSTDQGTTWPELPSLIKQAGTELLHPSVATGPRGLAYVSWQQLESTQTSMHYSRSPGVGLPWSQDTCLLSSPGLTYERPHVSVDANSILHTICIKGGQTQADEFVYKGAMQFLSSSPVATGFNEQKHIVRDVYGTERTTHIVYQDAGGIYYSHSDDAGLHWLVPELVAVGETPSLVTGYWLAPPLKRPVVAFLQNGSIVAAVWLGPNLWQMVSIEQCNPPYTVAGPPCLTYYANGSDEFFVVYQYQVRTDQNAPPNCFIRCTEFTGYGVQWTYDVAATGTEVCRDPAITNICLYPGFINNLHVVWEHNGEIDYRTRTNDVWENAVPISANYPPPVTEPGSHPSITVDGSANMLFAAWRGPDNNGNFPGDIWRRQRDLTWPNPGQWFDPQNQSQTAGQESDYPTMGSSFVTTWQEQVGSTWNLWAKFFDDVQGSPYVSSQVDLTFPQTTAAIEVFPGQEPFVFSNSIWTQAVRTSADPVFEVSYLRQRHVPSSGSGGGQGAGKSTVAERLRLMAGPNPCLGTSAISFDLSEPSDATLAIYDPSGSIVRTLLNYKALPGNQRICWDGRDEAGKAVPQGTYFCRLNAGRSSTTALIQLLR